VKRPAVLLALLTSLLTPVVVTTAARPAGASWVGDHCSPDHASDSNYRRVDAEAYDDVAEDEGYEWGGGCWNNNNKDDSPNATDSNGEGPDCSGLVFKAWELKNSLGGTGFEFWDRLENIHGPYGSGSFHAPAGSYPFHLLANKNKGTTTYMDAFAKVGHIGLISSTVSSNQNLDWISEAKGESYGTDEWLEGYRYDSAYVGVIREDWTPDCWPSCKSESAAAVVLP
jgi:hypothetical protein